MKVAVTAFCKVLSQHSLERLRKTSIIVGGGQWKRVSTEQSGLLLLYQRRRWTKHGSIHTSKYMREVMHADFYRTMAQTGYKNGCNSD
jgi:hypothetical protein